MPILDFPDAPVLDDVFDGTNGARYKWDGTLWIGFGAGSGSGGTVPPASGLTAVIHDASLTGDGTGTAPLGIDTVYLNNAITNSVIDAQGFVRAAPNGNQPPKDDALARINALERENAALKERKSRPPSPVQRAASRVGRRPPRNPRGSQ
jgi:hypothetical protein